MAVNSREEEGGAHRELLEFGNVLLLALNDNDVIVQIPIILYAIKHFPKPGLFSTAIFPFKACAGITHRAKFDHLYLKILTRLA